MTDLDGLDFDAENIFEGLADLEIPEVDVALDDDDDDYGNGIEFESEEQLEAINAAIQAKRCEPVPFVRKVTNKRIAVVDTETDPFAPGVVVKPFTVGVDMGDRYLDFWGDDCVKQFFEFVETLDEQWIFYAHNGGKFDFFFFLDYFDVGQTPLIMNGRIVKVMARGQEFRDSYAIIPQALSAYKKDEIDYNNFTRDKREKHKAAILAYQKTDCEYTRELIVGFHELFGDKLTIASAAFPMLNGFHGFERFKSESLDERFRRYYFGGRNQCFETGVLLPRPGRKWKVYDRNSMYPAEMRDTLHPISAACTLQTEITDETDFACIDAINNGALPQRGLKGEGLDFTTKRGTFYATIHEIRAGIDTGTLEVIRVRHAWAFDRKATFGEFVNFMYGKRLEMKACGDKVRDILYKYGLNSPYGKFALNPRKFKQYTFTIDEIPEPLASEEHPEGWTMAAHTGSLYIWSRPSPRRTGFLNVATAASITGAARANLLRNLSLASRPIYCDTDSIICEDFKGSLDDTQLGGWKHEATGDVAAIAGKKLYAIFDRKEAIKSASKGVRLTPAEIMEVCSGKEIMFINPVPAFKLDGSAVFTNRRINKTGVF